MFAEPSAGCDEWLAPVAACEGPSVRFGPGEKCVRLSNFLRALECGRCRASLGALVGRAQDPLDVVDLKLAGEPLRERRRRAKGLANVFKWPIWLAQLAGVVVGTPAATTVLLLTHRFSAPVRFVLGLGTFVALGTAAYLVAFRRRTRRALEVLAWLGEQLPRRDSSASPGCSTEPC